MVSGHLNRERTATTVLRRRCLPLNQEATGPQVDGAGERPTVLLCRSRVWPGTMFYAGNAEEEMFVVVLLRWNIGGTQQCQWQ